MARTAWHDLSPQRQRVIIAAATAQVTLAAAAWADMFRRQPKQVNGPRPMWAAIAAVNFVGPIAYFLFGRRRAGPDELTAR
jgi:hypothetical protein